MIKINKIFISIIACREPYLNQTIDSAINNAKNPESIYIGVLNTTFDKTVYKNEKTNVIVNNLYAESPPGIGVSRMYSINMCPEDADFILQVDAHMLFVKNWDDELIKSFNELEKKYNKLIISGMAFNWKEENGNIYLLNSPSIKDEIFDPNNMPDNEYLSKVKPFGPMLKFDSFEKSFPHGYPITGGYQINWEGQKYLEIFSVTGPFVFAKKEMFFEIQHDPRCVWGADEGVFAMRAWTRGYKIFSVPKAIVYHLDKGITKSDIDWRDKSKSDIFNLKMGKSLNIIKNIFLGNEIGYWGAPNRELLKEYSEVVGFDFEQFYKIADID